MVNFGASRQVQQAGAEITDVLQDRDVQGLGIVAGSSFGGVVVAQEIADRVLPLLQMPREPNTSLQFTASGVTKTGVALGFGALAARMSGLTTVVSGFMGVGALASAGADYLNALQRTGFFAEAPLPSGDDASNPVESVKDAATAQMQVEGDSGNPNQPPRDAASGGATASAWG